MPNFSRHPSSWPINGVSAGTPMGSSDRANAGDRTSNTNNSSSAYTIEIGQNLRVRSGPGETYSVIEVAKARTEVTILGSENGWSHVSYQRNSADQGQLITIEGYIKNSVLTAANTPTANKNEIREYLKKSPLFKYWTFEIDELFVYDGQTYRLPALQMN